MRIDQDQLIEKLLDLTRQAKDSTNKFKELQPATVSFRPSPNEWSILECLEHLNLYGDYYLPEIETQLLKSEAIEETPYFKSGILGDYFVSAVKADNGKKMKALKYMDPSNLELSITTIDRFLKQLNTLESLLEQSRKVNLSKVKTAVTLSRFIKIRLGDTLRFLVYHNERHIVQAERVLKKISSEQREDNSLLDSSVNHGSRSSVIADGV
ncbi:DinB family protein [Fulvivirgaceae bacterium BMA10]|uniref:DinB family protein n=1 Tax=Splendidivirga corallicola TaxID=3051826 RepID=A0ABT8KXP5_9BACT|nr:DinB family protein [Fulvivirgaceae bacterium BMA10]